jgi:hypothetical protein
MNSQQNAIVIERANDIQNDFIKEVDRLVKSGGISADDGGNYPFGAIFKVALQNMADSYGVIDKKAYTNLKRF